VPDTGEAAPVPVMVWIHGGGLRQGSNVYDLYGPQLFLDRNVLVVTINYRLGALGFLTLGNEQVPGNAGLRDQAMALAWVRDNIAKFGGDPSLVTVFGESAGSSSVHYQLLSPLTEGLFQRAIMQSGTALGIQWGQALTPEHAVEYGNLLAAKLGCDEEADVLGCLQRRNATEIVANSVLFGDYDVTWQAVPDSSFTSAPFLPARPEELMQSGQFHTEVELIIGTNKHEGILYMIPHLLDPSVYDQIRENWDTIGAAGLLGINDLNELTADDVAKSHQLLDFYIGGVENYNAENLYGLLDMHTDAGFLYGTYKTVRLLMQWGVRVHRYILTHIGQYSYTQLYGIQDPVGVSHADDLLYFWDPVFQVPHLELSGEDLIISNLMATAWTEFARSGQPSTPDFPLDWNPTWPGAGLENWFFNISGATSGMDSSADIRARMDLWDRVLGI